MGNTNTGMGYSGRKSDFNDAPARIDLVKSILDMRKVYSNMTDHQFIEHYRRKYRTGLTYNEIKRVLDAEKKRKAEALPPEAIK